MWLPTICLNKNSLNLFSLFCIQTWWWECFWWLFYQHIENWCRNHSVSLYILSSCICVRTTNFYFFFLLQGIIPILNWERSSFSTPHLALLVFVTVSLFPTIFLPSTPSMWVAGMTFGYGFGFLLIMPAVIIGVSLPYLVGSLFHHKIQVSIGCNTGCFFHFNCPKIRGNSRVLSTY